MQRTRRTERAWNWAAAVIHWTNPTLLRKHSAVWHSTVWSIALVSMILVIAGAWLGIVRYVNLKRLRRPGISPGGHPFLIVRNRQPQFSRLESADEEGGFDTQRVIPDKLLLSAVRTAWSPFGVLGIQAIAVDDLYRVRSNPLPDTARRIVLDDPTHTWVQIDAASGQVISVMDASQRLRRWLVDGLHSFDFPFLNHVGLLRHSLILLGAATGFLFSCTAVVIGVKRLRNLLGCRTA
jgi:hypothetical protein